MYEPGMKVIMKKKHPCGSSEWRIIRTGADFKIECMGCGRMVMLSREAFTKGVKKILEEGKGD